MFNALILALVGFTALFVTATILGQHATAVIQGLPL